MTTQLTPGRASALLFVAVSLVAMNLRMTITAVGPLLEDIGADRGLGPAALGLLGSLPLITWGLVSPLAHALGARLGMSPAVSWSLVVLAAGTVVRSLPGLPANLWIGTALIGVGLAIGNALLPAVIKRDFPARVPLLMGVYTALLGGTGSVGAGLAVPIAELPVGGEPLGWQTALLFMGAPIPIALALWVAASRRAASSGSPRPGEGPDGGVPEGGVPEGEGPDGGVPAGGVPQAGVEAPPLARAGVGAGRRIWRDPLAWQVSLYMGTQSAIFYSLSSWLAPYEIANGQPAVVAGLIVMWFQIVGIAGSLALPLIARTDALRRWLPSVLPIFTLLAMVGIGLWPSATLVWVVIGGLAGGGSLTMALTLMAVRARTPSDSSALSGMAQSLGYLIAAVGPFAFGALLGATGGWLAPFAMIWALALAQSTLGASVGRARFVLDR